MKRVPLDSRTQKKTHTKNKNHKKKQKNKKVSHVLRLVFWWGHFSGWDIQSALIMKSLQINISYSEVGICKRYNKQKFSASGSTILHISKWLFELPVLKHFSPDLQQLTLPTRGSSPLIITVISAITAVLSFQIYPLCCTLDTIFYRSYRHFCNTANIKLVVHL